MITSLVYENEHSNNSYQTFAKGDSSDVAGKNIAYRLESLKNVLIVAFVMSTLQKLFFKLPRKEPISQASI
jgi:hypothetical protein